VARTVVQVDKIEINPTVRTVADLPTITRSMEDLLARLDTYRTGARRLPVPTF
jgi:hypothetical protein